jgi:hypothetical protein
LKFKRPFQYIVSCLRALGADTHAHQPLIEYFQRMGQGPFQYPTPDGYPDRTAPWLGTLLWRWNFAFGATSNLLPTVRVPLEQLAQALGALRSDVLLPYFIGRKGLDAERKTIDEYQKTSRNKAELVALVLASPAFQRC